eukprot:scaffold3791_cov137-Cylindrotheca_fusiformis.AAC.13
MLRVHEEIQFVQLDSSCLHPVRIVCKTESLDKVLDIDFPVSRPASMRARCDSEGPGLHDETISQRIFSTSPVADAPLEALELMQHCGCPYDSEGCYNNIHSCNTHGMRKP